ncbi:hypothetical protein [Bradyrhizobium sp.]|uniref:hypothetical protein n=1 Tax=Bradyrhizobium sp. TaxID=376 RepID=UPI003C76D14D
MMQPDGERNPPQEPGEHPKIPNLWDRIKFWDRRFSVAKGLAIVTLLTSLFGGYFQYLNAYQDKVSTQAKEDMTAATATFTEVSNSFAEMQALQQILYSDFTSAVRDKSDASDHALSSKNAKEASDTYEKARTTLRENVDVLARKAEVYIDWASDIDRDPAGKRNVNDDPLTRSLLRDYDFNCSDKSNFPRFGNVDAKEKPVEAKSDEEFCAADHPKQNDDAEVTPANAFVRICASDKGKRAARIYWYSAKHHVLTMHYCFEAAHDRLEAVRDWASMSDRDKTKESEILAQTTQVSTELDNLAQRLNAFTSLALFQLERIRVKYRPVGFVCSVPLVRDLFTKCFPIRTATNQNH